MNTLIIWDWDDTCFPSYFFYELKIGLNSDFTTYKQYTDKLSQLSNIIVDILKSCIRYGKVIILTNAEANWVEQSSNKFLPNLLDTLKNISIISARTQHQKEYPDQCYMWKYLEMKNIITQSDYNNILCIGDSPAEHKALQEIIRDESVSGTYKKSLRFKIHPSLDKLIEELMFIKDGLDYFIKYEAHLDITLI